MLRKMVPIIVCVAVLVAATIACSAIRGAWSMQEAAVFTANVDDKIAADLAQSAIVHDVTTTSSESPVPDDEVFAQGKAQLGEALSDESKRVGAFEDMGSWVPSGEGASASILLASYDGSVYVYLVETRDAKNVRHVALYGFTGSDWERYAVFRVVPEPSADGE